MTDQASGEVSSIDPQGGVRPEEPSGSLEDLLAVIAHEIRSPLSVVRTAAETAVERDLPPDRLRKLLEIIRRNANLAMLVTDRLALARDVEMGAFALDPVEVDLVALTRETVSDLALSIPGGGHQVHVAGGGPVTVLADETSLREILFNLLLNAAKYSPTATAIEVAVSSENGSARLVVRDRGPGVVEADRERIFEKYEQVDRGTAGVGLGLYISRGLARANGGELAVDPTGGPGGWFLLTLPLAGHTS